MLIGHGVIYSPLSSQYDQLIELWEASVRATHGFLMEEDLLFYRSMLSKYLSELDLYCINVGSRLAGFLALGEGMVQALFVHPHFFGNGVGKTLMLYALEKRVIYKVDVNEQNTKALQFYRSFGFHVIDRSDTDATGRPYPILHLRASLFAQDKR